MNNFLLNCLESEKSKENFDKFLEDYLVAQLSENSWKQLFLFRIDSLTEIHAKLILETITQELKYLNKTIDEEERIRELKSACLKLFGERHWKLSHFQDFIRKTRNMKDLKNLTELLNTVYELRIKKADLKTTSDPENWTKNAFCFATKKVFLHFLAFIHEFLQIFSHSNKEYSLNEILSQLVALTNGKFDSKSGAEIKIGPVLISRLIKNRIGFLKKKKSRYASDINFD